MILLCCYAAEEEAQRVALARAAFSRPRLAVLCTPLSGSGPETAQRLLAASLAEGPLAAVPRLVSLAPNQAHLLHLSQLAVIVRSGGAAAACAPLRDLIEAAVAPGAAGADNFESSESGQHHAERASLHHHSSSGSPFLRGALAALLLEARGFPWALPAHGGGGGGGARRAAAFSTSQRDDIDQQEELQDQGFYFTPPSARLKRSNSAPAAVTCPYEGATAASWWSGAPNVTPASLVAAFPPPSEELLEVDADAWGPPPPAAPATTSRVVERTYSWPAAAACDLPTRGDFLLAYVALTARGPRRSDGGGGGEAGDDGNHHAQQAAAQIGRSRRGVSAASRNRRRRAMREAAAAGGNIYALRSSGRVSVSPDPEATSAAAEAASSRLKRALATAGAVAAWAAADLSLCASSFRLVQVIDSKSSAAAEDSITAQEGLPLAVAVLAVGGAACALGHAVGGHLAAVANKYAGDAAAAEARRRAAVLSATASRAAGGRLLGPTTTDAASFYRQEEVRRSARKDAHNVFLHEAPAAQTQHIGSTYFSLSGGRVLPEKILLLNFIPVPRPKAEETVHAAQRGSQALAEWLLTLVTGVVRTGIVCYLCPVLAAAVPPCALLCGLAGHIRASRGAEAAETAEDARDGADTLAEALSRPGE